MDPDWTMAKEKQPVANEKTISGGREEVKPETTGKCNWRLPARGYQ
ncbi:hypothetical protein GGP65_003143 [Salinibacter ruber]|nr:hypothetical protein [Salinibacter ruber]MCS3665500.1 hypothetical protein [Salinibacter ruber]MCS4223718.1 hypothetical protein [Salinibacter ruber]